MRITQSRPSSPDLQFQLDMDESPIVNNSPINRPAPTLRRQAPASQHLSSLPTSEEEAPHIPSATHSTPIPIPRPSRETQIHEANQINNERSHLESTIAMGYRIIDGNDSQGRTTSASIHNTLDKAINEHKRKFNR